MNSAANDPGAVKGRLTYDGKVYELRHVYAWQPPLQTDELWIYLTEQPLPPAAAQYASLLEELSRDKRFGGIKLIVHPEKPRLRDMKGAVYAPRDNLFSSEEFNFGPDWQALTIANRRVIGKARTELMSWTLEAEFSAPVYGSTGTVRTMRGAEAQRSPQADVFIAFEQAMVEQGLDAAGAYMTPENLAEARARIKRLGEASFKKYQAEKRASTPRGEARRKQIVRVKIDGDYAQVGTPAGPDQLNIRELFRTKDGWKIADF